MTLMLARSILVFVWLIGQPVTGHADGVGQDVWQDFISKAESEYGDEGRRAASFLYEARPERDEGISLDLLEENLRYALQARHEFPWSRSLSAERFHNDVLPYAVLDETRESWRPEFYKRCRSIVQGASTASEAAQTLNRELFNELDVHYNTGRKRPNQSPAESVDQGRATCTGLSIILVDACRSVGIPARVAGVASWHDKRGNHTWVEIWDGTWQFTGADEYNAAGLNRGWFVNDASKAIGGDTEHAVWATTWERTGSHFPMVWAPDDLAVHAVDVTPTYASTDNGKDSEAQAFVRVWDSRSGQRVVAEVEASNADAAIVCSGRTRNGTADLNDMPELRFPRGERLTLRVTVGERTRSKMFTAPRAGSTTLDLYWDELPLSRAEAEGVLAERWLIRAGQIAEERSGELEALAFVHAEHTLRYLERTFGESQDGERSLWISLHGGGGAPTEVNDKQWQNQIGLYEPEEGIYIAPRAPTDTWNLWHRGHIDPLFDRMIETYIATRGVDPDRVYLMGYSAGGDGVYQLAPRMADRFGAASMMAGHPNDAKPLGLRNLPFALFMGGEDNAYNRAGVARTWGGELRALHKADPTGYAHKIAIYEGLGHWMDRRDAEALPWMASFTRDPWPTRVVWRQDDVTHTRSYWLGVPAELARGGTVIVAEVDGQEIAVTADGVNAVTLRLSDYLLDLDLPIEVTVNGKSLHKGRVHRTQAAIDVSLQERADPRSAATALLHLRW